MSVRTRRHLELLKLGPPLRRYAGALQADPNASSLLVHQALSAAFLAHPHADAGSLEASLREDIRRNFQLGGLDRRVANVPF